MNGQAAGNRPGDPGPGSEARIIRRDPDKTALATASYGGQQGFNVWCTVEGEVAALEPGTDVIITCGPVGERVAMLARIRDIRGNRVTFVRQSPWRSVDTRAFPRFDTDIEASVFVRGEVMAARIVDLSLGGMAIEVGAPLSADSIEVQVGAAAPPVSCIVVSAHDKNGKRVLHVEFGMLGDLERTYIEKLVASVSDGEERELLAS